MSFWRPGVLTDATANEDAFWTVSVDSPLTAGDYNLVWVAQEDPAEGWPDQFVPLTVEAP